MVVEAVRREPVSAEFPCYQGKYREILLKPVFVAPVVRQNPFVFRVWREIP